MADTTKLAGRFTAWRLTIGVKPEDLGSAIKRCVDLGLLPEVRGYQDRMVLFRVLVPDVHNESTCPLAFRKEMASFYGALYHGARVELICPPADSKT
jgi:hypothetical protein